MKKLLITALTLLILCCGQWMPHVSAAPVWNMPTQVIQPNGDTLDCFVTGDEFYQRIHDAQNYTIVQDVATGYYVYAIMQNGQLTPSKHIAGTIDPATLGIEPGLTISYPELLQRHKRFEVPANKQPKASKAHSNHGILNNIVIFIRFADDNDIPTSFNYVNHMYNDSTENAISLFNYYQAATYKKLRIVTHFYPLPIGDSILSYQDEHPRNYYRPYTAANPIGYSNDDERATREFDLLENATLYVDSLDIIPDDLLLDEDNNGEIDNISYIVKGGVGGWSELLWPHKWNLQDRDVYLNGKKINVFNFLLEGAGSHYFGTSTLCHEMFHALGAPDLYHYYNYTNTHPVGGWDLMEQNSNPPQHMGAYMKYKYGKWITEIPTLEAQGTYYLNSVGDPRNEHNCYKILTTDSNQYYVLEYRNREDSFEEGLPGTGLLIYRIDTRFDGNAEFDKEYYFDEIYLFRPDGNDTVPGEVNNAYFSPEVNRTTFDYSTNPYPTLTQNISDSSFTISNIHFEGDSIWFNYIINTGCRTPLNLTARDIYGNSAELMWEGFSNSYIFEYSDLESPQNITTIHLDSTHYTLKNLIKNHTYQWRITSVCEPDSNGNEVNSTPTLWHTFTTMPCYNTVETLIGKGSNQENAVPINTKFNYSYTQQLFSVNEMRRSPINISKISFEYGAKKPLTEKNHCNIYLGHVNKTTFDDRTDLVPFEQLQLVYSGSINGTKGWNCIFLDSTFEYDGEHDLVLAIDDNSNAINLQAKFRTTPTSEYATLGCYSSDNNPDPAHMESFMGISSRKQFRSNIRFEGCDPNGDDDVAIELAEEQKVTITTHQLTIHLDAESAHTYQLYDVTGRLLNQVDNQTSCTMKVPQGGVYLIKIDNATTEKVVVF